MKHQSTNISIEERPEAFTCLLKKIIEEDTGDIRCCLKLDGSREKTRPLCERQTKQIHFISIFLTCTFGRKEVHRKKWKHWKQN